MSEISKKLVDFKFAKKVYDRLNNVADGKLPSDGAAAGAAVCSAIIEELGLDIAPVYNDIDIFIPLIMLKPMEKRKDYVSIIKDKNSKDNELVTSSEIISYVDNYGVMHQSANFKYSVISHARYGLINKVWISIPADHRDFKISDYRRTKVKTIISDFDINSTQVGMWLDSDTPELVFTKDFLLFLETRQLTISNWNTPAHSLLRLLKKKDELKTVYVDLEENIMLALTYIELHKRDISIQSSIVNKFKTLKSYNDLDISSFIGNTPIFFGDKLLKTYIKYKEELVKHVELVQRSNTAKIIEPNIKIIETVHEVSVPLHTILGLNNPIGTFHENLESLPRFNEVIKSSPEFQAHYKLVKNMQLKFSEDLFEEAVSDGLFDNTISLIEKEKESDVTSFYTYDNIRNDLFKYLGNSFDKTDDRNYNIARYSNSNTDVSLYAMNVANLYKGFKVIKKKSSMFFFETSNKFFRNYDLRIAVQDEYNEAGTSLSPREHALFKEKYDKYDLFDDNYLYRNLFLSMKVFGPKFLFNSTVEDFQWLEKHLKLFKGHDLTQQFLECRTIKEYIFLSKEILYWKSKVGDDIFGYLEKNFLNIELFLDRETVKNFIAFEIKKNNEPLKETSFSRILKDGTFIEELITGTNLKKEGKDMHHCVGGYSGSVRRGESIILKVYKDSNKSVRSTIELRPNDIKDSTKYTIVQVQGKFNKAVSFHFVEKSLKAINEMYEIFPLQGYVFSNIFCRNIENSEKSKFLMDYALQEGYVMSKEKEESLKKRTNPYQTPAQAMQRQNIPVIDIDGDNIPF